RERRTFGRPRSRRRAPLRRTPQRCPSDVVPSGLPAFASCVCTLYGAPLGNRFARDEWPELGSIDAHRGEQPRKVTFDPSRAATAAPMFETRDRKGRTDGCVHATQRRLLLV